MFKEGLYILFKHDMLAVLLAAFDTSTAMNWTLTDNTVQTFNSTELQQIGQALAMHINACHVKTQNLRTKIENATTVDELELIQF